MEGGRKMNYFALSATCNISHQISSKVVVSCVFNHQFSQDVYVTKGGWGHIQEHAPS